MEPARLVFQIVRIRNVEMMDVEGVAGVVGIIRPVRVISAYATVDMQIAIITYWMVVRLI